MSDHISAAVSAESEGDYERAARHWATAGFELLIQSNYQHSRAFREGLGDILTSIVADVRAGNEERAERHFLMTEALFKSMATDSEEAAARGLGWEWLGDASLVLDGSDAAACYDRAVEVYSTLSFDERMAWGAIPEFDAGYGAMLLLLDWQDIENVSDATLDFVARVEHKRDIDVGST